ncbi:MAG: protein tyrosine phosphatase [Opitutaceae bacterium]|nr:protein tyrosine phosphatase [Opitutaceae bacterium]
MPLNRPLRVLFVCSMNQWRSPTAERLYQNDARLQVRSAGTQRGARRRISRTDLAWADLVVVMEREHQRAITRQFPDPSLPPIEILDIPDDYAFLDPELQSALTTSIEPVLSLWLDAPPGRTP